jgi:drug/metabolite transporter (DMT)-like permease
MKGKHTSSMRGYVMGEMLAFLALIMFSFNVIVTKAASGRLNLDIGFVIALSVNVLFSGCLFIIQLLANGPALEFHWLGFVMFLVSGIFASYLGRSLYFDSIAKLGPAKASTFMVSNPLFTFLISWLFLGETLSLLELAGAVVVLIGLFIVSYIPPNRTASVPVPRQKWRQFMLPGAALALLGSMSYALGNITRGTAIQVWNEPILGGFLGALTGVSLQFLFNKQARNLIPSLRSADSKGVWLYALSGVLTISAQIGQIASMHYIPISIATLITTAQPLLVIPLSYFLLKNQEGIHARVVVGSLLVLIGISTIILY